MRGGKKLLYGVAAPTWTIVDSWQLGNRQRAFFSPTLNRRARDAEDKCEVVDEKHLRAEASYRAGVMEMLISEGRIGFHDLVVARAALDVID